MMHQARAVPTTLMSIFLFVGLSSPALAAGDPSSTPGGASPPPAVAGQGSAGSNPFAVTGAPAPEIKGPSVWGILPWGGIGVGARIMWPVGLPPLLTNTNSRVHDRWALEAGADLLHWSYGYIAPGFANFNYSWTELVPVVGIMWNVWLNDQFAFYPKVEIGYAFGWFSNWQGGGPQPPYGGPVAG